MAVDRIKYTKPASKRTFLDELEPIPYEITEEELASMDPRMKRILFGIEEPAEEPARTETQAPKPEVEEAVPEKAVAESDPQSSLTFEPAQPAGKEIDYSGLVDFPPAPNPHITVVFPVEDGEEELESLARAAEDHREEGIEGRRWHSVRFSPSRADRLEKINQLVGTRADVVTLVNGKRVPFGRNLWLPLMYIFTAGMHE